MKPIYKEHSTWLGMSLLAQGVAECIQGNYQTGVINIVLGVFGIVKREGKTNAE